MPLVQFRRRSLSPMRNLNDSVEPLGVVFVTNSMRAVSLASKLQILVLVDPKAAKLVEGVIDGLLEHVRFIASSLLLALSLY